MAACTKCGGKGEILTYHFNHGGVCFRCKGTGIEPSRRRKTQPVVDPDGPRRCTWCNVLVDQVMGVWYRDTFYCGDCEGRLHSMILRGEMA